VKHVFVGFGFGPIQSGLFAKEAWASGAFSEIVVAEIDAALVAAVRGNGDRYAINVAYQNRVETVAVDGVTLLDPTDASDAARLRGALGRATEMVTSLPSVAYYERGGAGSVARWIAGGLLSGWDSSAVVYTAENNNRAAELLEAAVGAACGVSREQRRPAQFLNTVIGKMSQVVAEPAEIARRGLAPVAPGFPRAILVESFNRILVSRIRLPGFEAGIRTFEEKDDLLPFEEAKLFGHNAAHTMLGFLGISTGVERLCELRARADCLALVRRAFVEEVGAALCARYGATGDPLFTPAGFAAYADDLLARMTNPHLGDTVARAVRDPLRKLGREDRLFGALRLCLDAGVEPRALAAGALAGLRALAGLPECPRSPLFDELRAGRVPAPATFRQGLQALWGDDGDSARVADALANAAS